MEHDIAVKEASPHYKVAGKALIGLGSINIIVALFFLAQSDSLGFIDSKMMIAFGTMFVTTGSWMISISKTMQQS